MDAARLFTLDLMRNGVLNAPMRQAWPGLGKRLPGHH